MDTAVKTSAAPNISVDVAASEPQYTVPTAEAKRGVYGLFKRVLDIVISFLAGLVLIVPMLVIAVIIRIDSPGKAIFRQRRLGKNGKVFRIIKFRTMNVHAELDGPQWAQTDDVRCTKVGRVLRKFRIDELPQLWNIFVGDMSFVGPRPERPYFYGEFEKYIHGFSNRLVVTPGLTGLAQVNGGYELPPEEKIVYDMEYIEKMSFAFDLKIIFKTVKLVFTHEGAR